MPQERIQGLLLIVLIKSFVCSLIISLSLSLSLSVHADAFDNGFAAYEKGDYKTAMELWKPYAKQGEPSAQYILGLMYDNGEGVPEDDKQAIKWYRLAADQGYADAQYNLGVMYANGYGEPKDDKQAVQWFRLAAEQGHAEAQFNLGYIYNKGQGTDVDNDEAVKWYKLAFENGLVNAEYNLGVMYANGEADVIDNTTEPWHDDILSTEYMKSLTKWECVAATRLTLSLGECDTNCLTNLSGIYGDCLSFSIGELDTFCPLFKKYRKYNCFTNKHSGAFCAYNELASTIHCGDNQSECDE